MQPAAPRIFLNALFTAFFLLAVGGCSWFKGETVRVPTICTNAPYCVPEDEHVDGLVSQDRNRHNAFVKHASESVVRIETTRWTPKDGLTRVTTSGALIGHKGLVLTTFRGVSQAQFITVAYRRVTDEGIAVAYREVEAELMLFSRERDIAVIRVKDRTLIPAPFPIRRGPSVPADHVWYFGTVTQVGKTVLGNTDAELYNSRGWIVTGATITASDAGSPIVNSCGELVGVLLFDNGKGAIYALGIDDAFKALNLKMQDLY